MQGSSEAGPELGEAGAANGGSPPGSLSRSPASIPSWVALLVLLVACLPSWGTLGAPPVSDDALILGHVHRENGFLDWVQPQFGLKTVRFWRPLVTTSWEVQEKLTGAAAFPLRIYNLACHAVAALLASLVLARLGAGRWGSLAAGLAVGLFPEQGGTLTWLAGRTDGTCSPFMLAAVLAVVCHRPRWSLALAFLACSAKEMAFVLPAWLALALWAQGSLSSNRAQKAFLAGLLGTVIAFLWRRLALGSWIGGYPSAGLGWDELVTALVTWARASSWSLGGVLVVGAFARAAGTLHTRAYFAGLIWALAGAAPLVGLLVDGVLEATNVRTLRVSDLGLALALGASLASAYPARFASLRPVVYVAALLVLGWRATRAYQDTHEWALAGEVAEAHIREARTGLSNAEPSTTPWLRAGFPATYRGAYCLAFGTADRFRAPFEPAPVPVWPLRPIFASQGSVRAPLYPEVDSWVRPAVDAPLVTGLSWESAEGERLTELIVEESIAREPDRSPVVAVRGVPPGAILELVLYTEIGYEPALFPTPGSGQARITEDGTVQTTLRQVFLSAGFVSVGEAVTQVADFGGTRAFLEVRARGSDGAVLAATPWLELTWSRELLGVVY